MEEKFLKLTSAVYKLLEYFPESDPLKNKAKEKALAIMSAYGRSPAGGENFIQEDIDVLLGYFQIAKLQGWLSFVNFLIITNEYEKLRSSVISAKAEIQSKAKLLDSRGVPFGSGNDIGQAELTHRQKQILEFINKNEKAQVMDLQKILPNITKRTIRRDLDDLLEASKIVRVGDFNQVFYKIK